MASGLWERAKARPSNTLLVALSVLLLATLGLASLYGFRYGKIDESVMPGRIELSCNDRTVATIDIAGMDHYASSRTANPMTLQYSVLEKASRAGTWRREGSRILVTLPEAGV